jgi:hypothetical protein
MNNSVIRYGNPSNCIHYFNVDERCIYCGLTKNEYYVRLYAKFKVKQITTEIKNIAKTYGQKTTNIEKEPEKPKNSVVIKVKKE